MGLFSDGGRVQVGTGGPVSGLACWPLCTLQMPLQLVVCSGGTPGHRGCLVTSRDWRAVGVPGDRAVQRSGLGVVRVVCVGRIPERKLVSGEGSRMAAAVLSSMSARAQWPVRCPVGR